MTRTQQLRKSLDWTQAAMAGLLGVHQATIYRLETGMAEPGPVALILDQVAASLARGQIVAGMTPDQAREILRGAPAATLSPPPEAGEAA